MQATAGALPGGLPASRQLQVYSMLPAVCDERAPCRSSPGRHDPNGLTGLRARPGCCLPVTWTERWACPLPVTGMQSFQMSGSSSRQTTLPGSGTSRTCARRCARLAWHTPCCRLPPVHSAAACRSRGALLWPDLLSRLLLHWLLWSGRGKYTHALHRSYCSS
jgi:hypothetical protein